MRKQKWILALVVSLPIVTAVGAKPLHRISAPQPVATVEDDDDFDMPVKEEETLRQQYPLAATGDRILDVDNVWGSIDVVGADTTQVQVVIKKTIRAETKEALEKAKREVTLDAARDDTSVRLYVNGPFRCHNNDGDGC